MKTYYALLTEGHTVKTDSGANFAGVVGFTETEAENEVAPNSVEGQVAVR